MQKDNLKLLNILRLPIYVALAKGEIFVPSLCISFNKCFIVLITS